MPLQLKMRCARTALVIVLCAISSGSQERKTPESPERFYIVKLATSRTPPYWADYILDVRANGSDTQVREFQIAPLGRFCSDNVTVKAAEKILPKQSPSQLMGPLNLCSPALERKVALSLKKYSYRRIVTISDSARFGVVAKCGDDFKVFDLPYPQGVDQEKLRHHGRETDELYSLFDRLQREAFGAEPLFHEAALSSDDHDLSQQQLAAKYIDDLRSGEFDRGFGGRNCRGLNSGCDERSLDSLLKNYKGRVVSTVGAQVRLLDADKLPLTRFVAPEYPPAAMSARMQDRVPLELELGPSGKVVNVTVLGGDEAFRKSAVAAARQWEFKSGSGRFVQTTLDYFLQCP